jgi:hypothetical protein
MIFACFPLVFSACAKQNVLLNSISQLRCNLYQGETENFKLKAGYGFTEQPFVNDGKVGRTINQLTFKLVDKETEQATYSLSFDFNGISYNGDFKLSPITDTLTCTIEIDNFYEKEFTVKLSFGGQNEDITLKSIIPENTISYNTALDYLASSQNTIISHYINQDGIFNAEIYLRVLVKDGKPFWYVGIASGGDNLKAFLIDGISGEILAVRDIF